MLEAGGALFLLSLVTLCQGSAISDFVPRSATPVNPPTYTRPGVLDTANIQTAAAIPSYSVAHPYPNYPLAQHNYPSWLTVMTSTLAREHPNSAPSLPHDDGYAVPLTNGYANVNFGDDGQPVRTNIVEALPVLNSRPSFSSPVFSSGAKIARAQVPVVARTDLLQPGRGYQIMKRAFQDRQLETLQAADPSLQQERIFPPVQQAVLQEEQAFQLTQDSLQPAKQAVQRQVFLDDASTLSNMKVYNTPFGYSIGAPPSFVSQEVRDQQPEQADPAPQEIYQDPSDGVSVRRVSQKTVANPDYGVTHAGPGHKPEPIKIIQSDNFEKGGKGSGEEYDTKSSAEQHERGKFKNYTIARNASAYRVEKSGYDFSRGFRYGYQYGHIFFNPVPAQLGGRNVGRYGYPFGKGGAVFGGSGYDYNQDQGEHALREEKHDSALQEGASGAKTAYTVPPSETKYVPKYTK